MRSITVSLLVSLAVVLVATGVSGSDVSTNPAYVCSFCLAVFGLVQEVAYQVNLQTMLQAKCTTDACRAAVEDVILRSEAKHVPEDICRTNGMCTDTCSLWVEWPVNPLPAAPPAWPIERRLEEQQQEKKNVATTSYLENQLKKPIDYTELRQILSSMVQNVIPDTPEARDQMPSMGVIAAGLAQIKGFKLDTDYEPCAHNVTCHIINFANGHLPLKDGDGDRYAPAGAKRFRGSDWRGADCDDKV